MLEHLNSHERLRIEEFCSHPLLASLAHVSWDQLLAILLQRRHLSLAIVNLYEAVIDGLEDEDIKVNVRQILHEEYPRNTRGVPLPSHRELLFQDLLNLGAQRQQILCTPESPITEAVRLDSQRQLAACLEHPLDQLGLLTFLRFWAEVLVSVEYTCLWPRLSERLAADSTGRRPRSEFFYFHMIHDRRQSDIGEERLLGGHTHAQALALHISRLIRTDEDLQQAMRQVDQACALKRRFYDQFLIETQARA
ncbi:MAG: hypothetical protein VKI42_00820 [Synechococcaceae cyanobacterium]|nr:hypothetical protein [Synechococcaceae cyanobacterium]